MMLGNNCGEVFHHTLLYYIYGEGNRPLPISINFHTYDMKRLSILALFVFATTMASFAQSTGGKLVVIQDDEVERLLKSKRTELAATRAQGNADEENTTRTETSSAQTSTRRNTPRRRFNSAGFRIQIFTGGNSRADKQAAIQAQQKCRAAFPELATYVHFLSPHWVCRVGDFAKREDAQRYVSRLRGRGLEARIVRSNVILSK